MHNAFLTINEARMGKSEGNFITLQTLKEKNIDPIALRYLFLTARYSSPVDFSLEALEAAQTAWKKLKRSVIPASEPESKEKNWIPDQVRNDDRSTEYRMRFSNFVNDNLDTPQALALAWEVLKDKNISDSEKRKTILDFDRVLGLELDKPEEKIEIPVEVQRLIDERENARTEKNWDLSDKLREQIEKLGFSIKDTENGIKVDKM